MSGLKEEHFEDIIYNHFKTSPLYLTRSPGRFDKDRRFDPQLLENFIQTTQPQEWNKLTRQFPGRETEEIMAEFNRLRAGRGILEILRFGFTLRGANLKFVYFKPASGYNEAHRKKYESNRFSVVRQFRYNPKHTKELDLVILLNGIPLITMELKNEFTGQNVRHATLQYSDSHQRDHRDPFLKSCLVHFAVDNKTVFMTTKLAGKATRFLPFNRDTRNPVIPGKFASCYLWEEVLQADSLLNILQNFIMHQKSPKTGKILLSEPLIFPRYHQLDVVRRLLADVKTHGAGRNYLVQHSAGSGKSKSISWLAHQLSNLFDAGDNKIFHSVIVITDRRVLDRQLQKDILEFEKTKGVVAAIGKGKTSKHLVAAIESGAKIIVSTLQKFGTENIAKIADLGERRFAVIVDEAHSSQSGESAKDLKVALTSEGQLAEMLHEEGFENEDPIAEELAKIMKQRQQLPHLSFFAFTATPKARTFEIFGIPDAARAGGFRAFHYYTMRQAIEEGFILNVLDNYTTYETYFELVEKTEADKHREFETAKARRLLLKEVGKHPHAVSQKVHIMLNHFMENTVHKISGRAKAMVVTASRAHAVLYKKAFDKILKEEYNNAVGALAAFSGTVEIEGEDHQYTEENMNPPDAKDIRTAFDTDKYRILVVANKFQTGFDQPLLHTMYVEKPLGGVAAVQTLSRLNRVTHGKKDTMVLDFVNDHQSIQTDFQDYFQSTTLDRASDTQKLYNQKYAVENHHVFEAADIDAFIQLVIEQRSPADKISSLLQAVVQRGYLPLDEEERSEFRKKINRFVRSYGFMSQVITFIDPVLEKFYLFTKLLFKVLPYDEETLPLEVVQMVDMDKYALEEVENGNIRLTKQDKTLENIDHDGHGGGKTYKSETLESIVADINEQYGYDFQDIHTVVREIQDVMKKDDSLRATMQADGLGDVKVMKFKESMQKAFLDNIEKFMEIMTRMDEDKAFGKHFTAKMFELYLQDLYKKQDESEDEDDDETET